MKGNYDKIPQELRDLPQWVTWKFEKTKKGETTKVPYIPGGAGRKAKSTDPTTWRTFTEATVSPGDGIGFMFSEDDGYCGIDLDHCLADGQVEEWAKGILDDFKSYTEVSPGGDGFHIIVKAELPGKGTNQGDIEMYDKNRYFTVTGDHLKFTPTTIEGRQSEAQDLYLKIKPQDEKNIIAPSPTNLPDSEILDLAKEAANGPKFSKLWAGEWEGDYPSQSEADLGLCSILGFYTGGDVGQIDRLFRQSGLMRPKWTENNGYYSKKTITKALSDMPDYYTPPVRLDVMPKFIKKPKKTFWTHDEILKAEFPEPRWAVKGIVMEGVNALAGRPKVGKSFLALQIAYAVGSGQDFFGRSTKQGKVLYIGLEDSPRRIQARLQKQNSIENANIVYTTEWPTVKADRLEKLDKILDEKAFELVIIDTFSKLLGDVDQMDAAKMTSVLSHLQRLSQHYNLAILLIDHHRKRGSYNNMSVIDDLFGVTAKAAVCDTLVGLYRDADETLLKIVGRDVEEQDLSLDWNPESCTWELLGEAGKVRQDTIQASILDAIPELIELGDLPTNTNIAKYLNKDKGNVSREIKKLLELGLVIKGKRQTEGIPYSLTPEPKFFPGFLDDDGDY